jgi:hypothetical protein
MILYICPQKDDLIINLLIYVNNKIESSLVHRSLREGEDKTSKK